ncbi:MAG: nucleotide pyrophosphohydrolase [Thermoplasmata archaeon]
MFIDAGLYLGKLHILGDPLPFVVDEDTLIADLKKSVSDFVNERDWEKFHNQKDLAISLSIEIGELLELFQWKNPDDIDIQKDEVADKVKEELADVIIYALSLANATNIDISEAVLGKIKKNEGKYPVNEWKGKAWL